MCGRYQFSDTRIRLLPDDLHAEWRVPPCAASYNIAPGQYAPVVLEADGRRVIDLFRWGLIPGWAKDPSIGNRLINARSETAAQKPAFRSALRSRRCLVPAAGFYEWQRTPEGKQPHHLHPRDGLLTFAGLWETWRPAPAAEPIPTFTILTTHANPFMAPIHDRMPVILTGAARDAWLDPGTPAATLGDLMRPAPDDYLVADAISTRVNSPANDSEDLLLPLEA